VLFVPRRPFADRAHQVVSRLEVMIHHFLERLDGCLGHRFAVLDR
jgi:hypothetical protein